METPVIVSKFEGMSLSVKSELEGSETSCVVFVILEFVQLF